MNSLKLCDFNIRPDDQLAGQGGYGKVWDAWHRKHKRVAVKLLDNGGDREAFEKEAKLMLKASQDLSGVPMIGYIYETGNGRNYLGIVLQFMCCGSLYDLLHKHEINIPRSLTYRILHEISCSMHKLHEVGVDQRLLHFDLKPSNILLDQDLHAKIADFGASRLATNTAHRTTAIQEERNIRTIQYCAPEFLQPGGQRTSKYDVYSFGIMMWEILANKKPFEDLPSGNFEFFICDVVRRPNIQEISLHEHTNIINDLIPRAWNGDPDRRPSFEVIESELRPIVRSYSENQLDDAVKSVKSDLLRKLNRANFTAVPEHYQQNLADLVNAIPPHETDGARNHQLQPEGDVVPSGFVEPRREDRRFLSDSDCLELGSKLYYSSGWEVLGYRLGLPRNVVENIKLDVHGGENMKIELFRRWKQLNGGGQPLIESLVELLRKNNVSLDVWEFLLERT